jgi:hypothetical protein
LTSDTSVGLLKTLTLALSRRERGLIGGLMLAKYADRILLL